MFNYEFDRTLTNFDKIYRITSFRDMQGREQEYGLVPATLGLEIKNDIPGIERASRIMVTRSPVKLGDDFFSSLIIYNDPDFVDIFTLIRSFLAYAYKNWTRAPRYAVLIGEGTYDYKDYSGMGGNLMPPLMVSTPDGIVASDTALADVDGDHLPEIAIGRLPVLTPEELDAVINKIKAYESATDKSWRNRIVMMADHPEEGANFPLDSDSVAAVLPQGYDVSRIYMSQQSITSARTLLMNALQNGAGLINYVGHGGPDRLEQDGLLKNSDVAS